MTSNLSSYSDAIRNLLIDGFTEPAETLMTLKDLPVPEPEQILFNLIENVTYGDFRKRTSYIQSVKFLMTKCVFSKQTLTEALQRLCRENKFDIFTEMIDILILGGLDLSDPDNLTAMYTSGSKDILNFTIERGYMTSKFLDQLLMVDGEFMSTVRFCHLDFMERCVELYCMDNPCPPTLKIDNLFNIYQRQFHHQFMFADIFERYSIKVHLSQSIIDAIGYAYGSTRIEEIVNNLMKIMVVDPEVELNTRNQTVCEAFNSHGIKIQLTPPEYVSVRAIRTDDIVSVSPERNSPERISSEQHTPIFRGRSAPWRRSRSPSQ